MNTGDAMEEPSVMVVDEHARDRQSLAAALANVGFKVCTSPDGLHAVICILHDPPDYLLVNDAIGGVDPVTMCEMLRKDRRTATCRIVLLVHANSHACLQRCRALGLRMLLKGPHFVEDAVLTLVALANGRFGAGRPRVQRAPAALPVGSRRSG